MDLEARTLKSLEWTRLKGYLASECSSTCSAELAKSLAPKDSSAVITILLHESEEGLNLLYDGLDLTQEGLPDIREQINRLRAGASISARELLDLKKVLSMSKRTKNTFSGISDDDYPNIKEYVKQLASLDELVRAIDDVLDESASVRDDASPKLRSLRRDLLRNTQQIKDELLRIINSPQLSKCLQEPIYTVRNGRHVLPVLANMRQSIDGVVHDSSSSGLTIYVEPLSVVELTNKLRINEAEIEREIERLLWELSALASKHVEVIDTTFLTLVELDFIAARARLARKYEGKRPEILNEPKIQFHLARHPLLVLQSAGLEAVIPNDIILGDELRSQIITGPNTGGKTVYLKTAGLLCLMMRAGLLLPVDEKSSAGIFSGIYADIGDEQSLEQNLSTFSSHMGNIIEILRRASEGALVLLDEIGAGTDPREGVVLAKVILSDLCKSGALTICSTHYGDLKTLAHSFPGFGNASMEFDEKTLRPSYRMRPGIPGSSKAIAVAARLGLSEELVAAAKQTLANEKEDLEIKIDEIEKRLHAVAEREDRLAREKSEVEQLKKELLDRQNALEAQFKKSKAESASKFEQDYDAAKKLINELTAQLQKTPSLSQAQKAKEQLEILRKDLQWLSPDEYNEAQSKITQGQTVKVRSLNQIGHIEELPADGDEKAVVRIGRMKVKVSMADLEPMKSTPPAKSKQFGIMPSRHARTGSLNAKAQRAAQDPVFVRTDFNTLDLRGLRVDEALQKVETFIDTGYLQHVSPLMIIHGHGTGAIKSAVRAFLSNCSYKNEFRPGETYEGGDGVTVVNFK